MRTEPLEDWLFASSIDVDPEILLRGQQDGQQALDSLQGLLARMQRKQPISYKVQLEPLMAAAA